MRHFKQAVGALLPAGFGSALDPFLAQLPVVDRIEKAPVFEFPLGYLRQLKSALRYPELTRADIQAVLDYARQAVLHTEIAALGTA
jgi:hypothetical protein